MTAAVSSMANPRLLERTPLANRWRKFFVYSAAVLSTTILLKVAMVQYLEIIYLINIALLLRMAARRGFHFQVIGPFYFLFLAYMAFSVAALLLAVASLRFTFYYPTDMVWRALPVVITIQRLIELIASVTAMVYMAHVFTERPALMRAGLRIYFWTSVISVIYSIVTFPLAYMNIAQLGTYLQNYRFRGFYNEGGPWGVYLVGAVLVSIALREKRWLSARSIYIGRVFLGIGLIFSYSKAAYVALLILLLLQVLMARSMVRRVIVMASIILIVSAATYFLNYNRTLERLVSSGQVYERISYLHRNDPNYVAGRVAGTFILPRMIAAEPWTGIGWGNYPLLRNRPEYRGASVWFDQFDDPGLGLLTYLAELGVPCFLLLMACLLMPAFLAARWKAKRYIVNLALLQPICHIAGNQLNVTYPWVVSAFALGLAYSVRSKRALVGQSTALEVL